MVSNRQSTISALLRWIWSGYHQPVLVFRYLALEHPVHPLGNDPYLVKMKVVREARLRPLCFPRRSFLAAGALYGPLKA